MTRRCRLGLGRRPGTQGQSHHPTPIETNPCDATPTATVRLRQAFTRAWTDDVGVAVQIERDRIERLLGEEVLDLSE